MAKVLDMGKHKDSCDIIANEIRGQLYSMVVEERDGVDVEGMIEDLACRVRDMASDAIYMYVSEDWIEEVD